MRPGARGGPMQTPSSATEEAAERRVWITRAEPGASATAERVRGMGLTPVVAPLLEVRALGEGDIDLAGVGALAFTSANAVRAFAARSAERAMPVFAVGEASAAAARQAGFTEVASAEGDVDALAALIAERRPAGRLLHPGAVEPAGDLTGALAAKGLSAVALALYETTATPPDEAVLAAFTHSYAVLVHSPKAARLLAQLLARRPAPWLRALALSAAVAAPLRGFALAQLEAAALPTEDALLKLLA